MSATLGLVKHFYDLVNDYALVIDGKVDLETPESEVVEDCTELCPGLYSDDGDLKYLVAIVGDDDSRSPVPCSYDDGENFIWLLEEPVNVDKYYNKLESVLSIVNSGEDFKFAPAINLDHLVKGSAKPYQLADFFPKAKSDQVSDEILETEICISGSRKGRDDKYGWKNATMSVANLIALLSEHKEGKKDGQAILQGRLIGNQRKAQAVSQLDLVILDLDTGDSMDVIEARIRELGLFCVMYTTHSHMKPTTDIKKDILVKFMEEPEDEIDINVAKDYLITEKRYNESVLDGAELEGPFHKEEGIVYEVHHKPMPKFRLVFLLDKPFVIADMGATQKEAIDAWKEYYAGVAETLRAAYDRSCVDPSRLMYLPRHPKGAADYSVKVIAGNKLDLKTIRRVPLKGHRAPQNAFEAAAGSSSDEVKTGWLRRFMGRYADRFEVGDFMAEFYDEYESKGSKRHFVCPNDDSHSDAGNSEDRGFFCVSSSESDSGQFAMKCMHDSCAALDRMALLDLVCSEHELEMEDLKEYTLDLEGDEVDEEESEDDGEERITSYAKALERVESWKKPDVDEAKKVLEWIKSVRPKDHDQVAEDALIDRLVRKAKIGKKTIVAEVKTTRQSDEDWQDAEAESREAGLDMNKRYIKRMKQLNKEYALVKIGKNVNIARIPEESKKDQIKFADINMYTVDSFRTIMCGEYVSFLRNGDNKTLTVGDAWISYPDRRYYDGGLEFQPDPRKANPDALNLWTGFPHKGKKGKFPRIHQHIFEVLCDENEYYYHWVMTWFAHTIQKPGEKPGSALVIKGKKGSGKSIIFEVLWQRILGRMFMMTAKMGQATGKFNAHLFTNLMILLEEASWGGDKQAEGPLKTLITSTSMTFEPKGETAYVSNNYTRVVMLSNENWAVPVTEDERRYMALLCRDTYHQDTTYFNALMDEINDDNAMRAFIWELENWEADWSILYNPPKTPWLKEQQAMSLTRQEEFFIDFIDNGYLEEDERAGLDEIVLDEEQETMVDKMLLRNHFMTYCNGGKGRGHVKNIEFKTGLEKFLGVDTNKRTRRSDGPGGKRKVDVVVVPPVSKLRASLKKQNLL